MPDSPEESPGVQPGRLKNLLRDLVDIYSPSGKEEEISGFAEDYLQQHGLTVTRQEADENRYNLLVLPDDEEIELCYVGHLDTVTAYDLEDYGFGEDGDTLSGLGTSDMKAGCTAMMEAFVSLRERGEPLPPVALALVVDEEESNKGARALVEEYSFPWAIVGEPTGLTPCLGHYGYLEVLLRTQGKRAHSAMPELGQNAIESMLRLLLRITEFITASTGGMVYNIREMSGFPGGFVVPDTCEAWLDLHLPPNSSLGNLKAELEQSLKLAEQDIPGLDALLRFEDTYSGYRIAEERGFVQKLKGLYQRLALDWEPQDFRSHSDGNVLWAAGVDPIILGPGRLEEAHAPDESVSFTQMSQAARLYLELALSMREQP